MHTPGLHFTFFDILHIFFCKMCKMSKKDEQKMFQNVSKCLKTNTKESSLTNLSILLLCIKPFQYPVYKLRNHSNVANGIIPWVKYDC